jgi:hypothetical protein
MNQFTTPTIVFWSLLIFNIVISYVVIDTLVSELTNNRIKAASPSWPVFKGTIEEARIIEKEAETEENTGTGDGESIHEYLPQIVYSYVVNNNRFVDSTKTYFGRFFYISDAINKLKQLIGDREFTIYKRGRKLSYDEFIFLKQIKTISYPEKQEIDLNVNPKNPHETSLSVSPEKNVQYIILEAFFVLISIALMIFLPYKIDQSFRINLVVIFELILISLYVTVGKRFLPEYKNFEPRGKSIIVNHSTRCTEWVPFLDEYYINNSNDQNVPHCDD